MSSRPELHGPLIDPHQSPSAFPLQGQSSGSVKPRGESGPASLASQAPRDSRMSLRPIKAFWFSDNVDRWASPWMAVFTVLPRELGLGAGELGLPSLGLGLGGLELDPWSPPSSGPQSSSIVFWHEQQPQQRAQKGLRLWRACLSGSGSGSGEGVMRGCQGFPPQRPTSERGLPVVVPVWTRQGGSDHSHRPPLPLQHAPVSSPRNPPSRELIQSQPDD